MMNFVAWKQSRSRFPEQRDFSGSKIICILDHKSSCALCKLIDDYPKDGGTGEA